MSVLLYLVAVLSAIGSFIIASESHEPYLWIAGALCSVTWFAFGRIVQLLEEIRDSLRSMQKAGKNTEDRPADYDELGTTTKPVSS